MEAPGQRKGHLAAKKGETKGEKRRNLRCLKREKEASEHVYREGKRMDGSVAKYSIHNTMEKSGERRNKNEKSDRQRPSSSRCGKRVNEWMDGDGERARDGVWLQNCYCTVRVRVHGWWLSPPKAPFQGRMKAGSARRSCKAGEALRIVLYEHGSG